MNDRFYKKLVEKSSLGYAYHKIICNEKGKPADYMFLEANKKFEELTGMKARDIIGKTIVKVLPGIENNKFDWISSYGEVALNGEEKEFEQYSEPLSKWFKVKVYSPEKGSFVTIFSDITDKRNKINAFLKISEMYEDFWQLMGEEIDYQKITDNFLELADGKLAYLNLYDEDRKGYTTMALAGDKTEINNIMIIIDMKLNRKKWMHDPVRTDKIKDKTVTHFASLHDLAGDLVPKPINDLLTKNFDLGETVVIQILGNNAILGDFTLIMPRGKSFNRGNIVEIFTKQLGLALIRAQAEQSKKLLLDNIQTQVWYLTNEYTYGAVNQAYADFIGVEIEDLSYKEMYEIYPVDWADKLIQANIEVFASGKKISTKKWIANARGEKRLISITKTPKLGLYDNVDYVVCSAEDITEEELANQKLRSSEAQLNSLISNTPAVIYSYRIDTDRIGNITYLSDNIYDLLGFKPEDFIGNEELWTSRVHPEDLPMLQEKLSGKEMVTEYRFKDKKGEDHWIIDQQRPYKKENGLAEVIGTFWDITDRKEMEEEIFSEREQFKTTLMSVNDGVVSVDTQGHVLIMNKISEKFTGWTQEEALGKPIEDVFHIIDESTREARENPAYRVLQTGHLIEHSSNKILISENGLERNIEDSAAPIKDEKGNTVGVVLVFRDSTEKKEKQKQIEFLSYHDQLTGLYNRRYYEKEKVRLNEERYYPLALIMVDVNGLKLTNDAFGHNVGDLLLQKIANVLERVGREKDLVARIGGDEFVLLLPKTNGKNAEIIMNRINKAIRKEKMTNIVLSVSTGYAIKEKDSELLDKVFMRAENDMYQHKLSESASMRSKTMDLIINTLYEKNSREKFHSERVGDLSKSIAEKMNFTEDKISEMKTTGLMHDIGKIGIDEAILNKKGKLTSHEWEEIKRHPEIGYRILSSVEEFSPIANYVLEHHEKWDGKGYPKGLKGEEISVQARIIAVVDAYDAMTAYRTYRKALSKEEAIAEIKKHSGSQFDPAVVKVFVEDVLNK